MKVKIPKTIRYNRRTTSILTLPSNRKGYAPSKSTLNLGGSNGEAFSTCDGNGINSSTNVEEHSTGDIHTIVGHEGISKHSRKSNMATVGDPKEHEQSPKPKDEHQAFEYSTPVKGKQRHPTEEQITEIVDTSSINGMIFLCNILTAFLKCKHDTLRSWHNAYPAAGRRLKPDISKNLQDIVPDGELVSLVGNLFYDPRESPVTHINDGSDTKEVPHSKPERRLKIIEGIRRILTQTVEKGSKENYEITTDDIKLLADIDKSIPKPFYDKLYKLFTRKKDKIAMAALRQVDKNNIGLK